MVKKIIKLYIVIFSLIFISYIVGSCSKTIKKDGYFDCKVVSVHDGDTFTCKNGIKVRVWGIDTPELPPKVKFPEPGAIESRNYLQGQILNKTLSCRKKDISYSRIVCQCFLNNKDIAKILLDKGLAKELPKYSKGYYSQYSNKKPVHYVK